MRAWACALFCTFMQLPADAHALLSSKASAQHASQSCAETLVAPGNVNNRNGASFSVFFNSNPSASVPKREVMRRDPSGLAENVLTPPFLLFRDRSMRFNLLRLVVLALLWRSVRLLSDAAVVVLPMESLRIPLPRPQARLRLEPTRLPPRAVSLPPRFRAIPVPRLTPPH